VNLLNELFILIKSVSNHILLLIYFFFSLKQNGSDLIASGSNVVNSNSNDLSLNDPFQQLNLQQRQNFTSKLDIFISS
jgi:hypothetical protein